jgi:sporulation protein YlmC with PRC-barrel domain
MRVKTKELMNKDVYAEDSKIGKVKEIEMDSKSWKVTHLEVELTKEAAKSLLGARTSIRNKLATSSLKKGAAFLTDRGIEVKVSKKQLRIYLRPTD